MKRVVVIGAGGHGREVAEILRDQARRGGALTVLGFIDDSESMRGQTIDGLPVLGDWMWFDGADLTDVAVICAVGQPLVCRRLVQRALALGLPFVSAISPLAHISSYAQVGQGVTMFPHVVVNTGALIGDYCILNVGTSVSHDVRVGRYSNVNPGVHLAGNVTVGEGCYIGMGTNVIQGQSIGSWTTVGASAVVVRDLPDSVIAVGVPARVIKTKKEEE
jgi:sugar O-acyltransferase (sialic acid O-acetyltransferase NeuD family)